MEYYRNIRDASKRMLANIAFFLRQKLLPRCKPYRKIPWIMNIKARGSYGCLIQPLGHT